MSRRAIASLRLLTVGVLLLGSAAGAVESADDIMKCMKANQPSKSSVQTIAMRSKDRIGAITSMHAQIWWRKDDAGRSQLHMRFDDPPDLRDSALLLLEKEGRNDMFMFLPELGRTRRVTAQMMNGSMFGTDFTYEDFEVLQGIADTGSLERGEDAVLDDRPAYVLVQTPDAEVSSPYDRIRTYVDRDTCLARRIEFFGRGDQLRKELDADWSTAEQVGSVWIAKRIVQKDVVEGTETELEIEKIEVDVDIPRHMFSQSSLERRR
jgi:hypothetical protein